MRDITENLDIKVNTKVSSVNDKDNSYKPICLLAETHRYLDGIEILERVADRVFVDLNLGCPKCEEKVRHDYAEVVNAGDFEHPYKLYRDTCIKESFKNLISYTNVNLEQEVKLKKLQADLDHFYGEKTYTPELETWEQIVEFFEQQGCEIEDEPPKATMVRDFGVEETKAQITIRFPQDRDFILPEEMVAIDVIVKEAEGQAQPIFNFKDKTVTIKGDGCFD